MPRKEERIKQLLEELKQNTRNIFESKKYRDYLYTLSKFHNYSYRNTRLIYAQNPLATRIAGYNKWKKDFNRQVIKGEKGIMIIGTGIKAIKNKTSKKQKENNISIVNNPIIKEKEDEDLRRYFFPLFVFDISQTKGDKLPSLTKKLEGKVDDFQSILSVLEDISQPPIFIRDFNGEANGYYNKTDNEIVVKDSLSDKHKIKTIIHEIAHSIMHKDIKKDEEKTSALTRTREIEAESVAFVVSNHLGVDSSDYSFGYLASWAKNKSLSELDGSLSKIHSVSSKLIKDFDEKYKDLNNENVLNLKDDKKLLKNKKDDIYDLIYDHEDDLLFKLSMDKFNQSKSRWFFLNIEKRRIAMALKKLDEQGKIKKEEKTSLFSFAKKEKKTKKEKKVKRAKKLKKEKTYPINNDSEIELNPHLLNLISPINISFNRNDLEVGENFGKVFGIIRYPDKVDTGWLSKISNIPSTIVAISLRPVDSSILLNVINKNIISAKADTENTDPLTRQRAEKMIEDNTRLLYQIDQNNESVVKMGVSIMPFSNTKERLKTVTRSVEATLNVLGAKIRLLSYLQKEGFKSISGTFPISPRVENITGRIMPLSTFVGGFPFSSSGLNDMQGYYFAKDSNGSLIILDPWYRGEDRTNTNITILGVAGTGKTTVTKHIILSEFMRGTKIIIIDPENEYSDTTLKLGGDLINAGGSSKSKINILQIKPSPKLEDEVDDFYNDEESAMALHIKNLEIFFKLYKKDFSDIHLALLKKELIVLYNSFNIFWDTDISKLKPSDFPIISDLYMQLKNKADENNNFKVLLTLLEDISFGADSFIFNGITSIEANSNVISLNTFSIQSSSEAVKRAQYFNLLNWAWEQMARDNNERVMLICDEAYLLIDPEVPQTAAFLRNVEKRCRKVEGSLVVISHSVIDFLHESVKNYGQSLLDIPTFKIIFGADGENLNQLDKLYKLNDAQKNLLESKKRANALLMVGSKRMHVKFDIPEYKFKYFGTKGGR